MDFYLEKDIKFIDSEKKPYPLILDFIGDGIKIDFTVIYEPEQEQNIYALEFFCTQKKNNKVSTDILVEIKRENKITWNVVLHQMVNETFPRIDLFFFCRSADKIVCFSHVGIPILKNEIKIGFENPRVGITTRTFLAFFREKDVELEIKMFKMKPIVLADFFVDFSWIIEWTYDCSAYHVSDVNYKGQFLPIKKIKDGYLIATLTHKRYGKFINAYVPDPEPDNKKKKGFNL